MMRRFAFVVLIVGMFVLVAALGFGEKKVMSYGDLIELEVNQKVFLRGVVESERVIYEGTKLIVLENGVELICGCSEIFYGKSAEVNGIVEEYEGKKQVRVLEIIA